jgi:serine/threonine-protein kinase
LDERIATGGMGDVWRGTDIVLGRVVAVKVLRAAMLADPEFSARFYGEARMMAAFRHPGVVEVYDYASAADSSEQSQCAYLVMAYVEGEPLSSRLKEAGRLGVAETMSIVAQAADALHAAHENGTVHRDVKPGNLIVKPNGTVILVDFGVARSAAVTSVTGLNAIVGTALYMAPEQVSKGNVTPGTDIYALGAVAYHCIAGHPPCEGDNALQVALRHLEDEPEPLPADVPGPVRELISRAMAKQPQDRFASAADFADAALAASGSLEQSSGTATALVMPAMATAITRAPTGTTIRTIPAPVTRPIGAPPRRRPPRSQLVVMLTVLGLLLAAGGIVTALLLSSTFGAPNGRAPNPPAQVPSVRQTTEPADDEPTAPTRSVTTRATTRAPDPGNPLPTTQATPTASPTPTAPSTTAATATPTVGKTSSTPADTTVPTTAPVETPTTVPPTTTGTGVIEDLQE